MRGKASPAPLELRPEVGCAVNVSAGGGGGAEWRRHLLQGWVTRALRCMLPGWNESVFAAHWYYREPLEC